MADWYISSTKYATYTAFVGSHAYSIGDLVVPTAPTGGAKWVHRCTTAGTSTTEPTWATTNNGTCTSGGATFTNVTGQSTYAWSAAAGDYPTLVRTTSTRPQGGDRIFISSDHSESTPSNTYGSGSGATASFNVLQVLSVNKAGSTPPVAADLAAGAVIACSGTLTWAAYCPIYSYGITYSNTGSASTTGASSGSSCKTMVFDNCTLYQNNANSVQWAFSGSSAFPNPTVVLMNSTLNFGATGQSIGCNAFSQWEIYNTALAGTAPTTLFSGANSFAVTVRGCDLSSITGTLVQNGTFTYGSKFLFDSCKIASGATRYAVSGVVNTRDLVEFISCFDGTNTINESYQPAGTVTTERTITLTNGATDTTGAYSLKLVSNTNCDKFCNQLHSFWLDVNNTSTGVSKTATIEVVSSTTLNNDELSINLEYCGTSSSPVASFVNNFIATPLTTPAAVTSSSASWNSLPGSPVTQKLTCTFTPQTAGRVRARVRLGKASTTVYVNPQITIS